jgi:PHP family Zn ribbon phosphoesterase
VVGSRVNIEDFLNASFDEEAFERQCILSTLMYVLQDDWQSVHHLLTYCARENFVHLARTMLSTFLKNFAAEHNQRLQRENL